MLAIKINDRHTEEFLAEQARRQGKSRQTIVRDMIRKQIEDAEDYQAAVEAKRRIESGEATIISAEEIWKRLELAN